MELRIPPLASDELHSCDDVFIADLSGTESRAEWSREDATIRSREFWDEPRQLGLIAHELPGNETVGFVIGKYVQAAEGVSLRIGELYVYLSRQGFGFSSLLLLGSRDFATEAGAVSNFLKAGPAPREFCLGLGFTSQQE
jgi:hypothetical protein